MGVHWGMPKVSVYVPDKLYDELRRRQLPISQLAQQAFADALAGDVNAAWIAAARARPVHGSPTSTEDLMADVDDDFGA